MASNQNQSNQGNNISAAHTPVAKHSKMPNTFTTTSSPLLPKDSRSSFSVYDSPRPNDKYFTRMDLTPSSQKTLESAYTQHQSFNRLNDAIISQADVMRQEVWDAKSKPGEMLAYEQLLQGMLEEGEMLLLGGSWLHFSNLDFLAADGKEHIKPSIGKGRLCLTNKRLLILSADVNSDASLSEFGDATKPDGGFKLRVAKCNSVYYQNIPLSCFLDVELASTVGNAQESRLKMVKPLCCGLCSCLGLSGCRTSWRSSLPMPIVINKRLLRLGVSMPPWHTQTLIVVHLVPEMPLTAARDFIAEIQHHGPLLH